MTLPIDVTYAPMEAKLVDALPDGDAWQYEPKWDGFRCLAFKDGDDVDLRSKSGQPFDRYFPEIVDAVRALPVPRCVLDGELVVPDGRTFSFDELLLRIHPAESRVRKLAREHPALYVVFDLLVDARGRSLVDEPLSARRQSLERFAARAFADAPTFRLSPATRSRREADRWLSAIGEGLDGIVAKRADFAYRTGERTGMQKYKRMRTADCVVGGFRYGAKSDVVGSLLLGLYDDEGLLDHVGFTSNIPRGEREALTQRLEALIAKPGFTGRAPGGPSRWSTERSGEWEPLAPKLVVEVRYDHFSAGRFRHGTSFLRFRPDKMPRQCTFEQVRQTARGSRALLEPT
ncbi:MAG TPA: ATP-dependent DNA ligase [Casimicrobiaceae bacterium]|jgi:ATP-dependent DNA ligase|nr:ATP-dependent DNA ligase [Casimicrobiaceae bacterium]